LASLILLEFVGATISLPRHMRTGEMSRAVTATLRDTAQREAICQARDGVRIGGLHYVHNETSRQVRVYNSDGAGVAVYELDSRRLSLVPIVRSGWERLSDALLKVAFWLWVATGTAACVWRLFTGDDRVSGKK